jgi:hypothetical protein
MAYTTIDKPTDYFNTNLYTGNNTETSHTVGFQPDWTWLKVRNAVGSHYLFDSVRGATKYIRSNSTGAEGTDANTLKSFDANGYTVGTSNAVNTNNETMVGWNWLANGSGSANTDGSISSTVSANTTSGFSIVSYTGNATANATVGHGLGVAPSCIIVKKRNGAFNWGVYHKSTTAHKQTTFTTNLPDDDPSYWNDVEPTSSVFNLGSGALTNGSGSTMIAYCFAEKQGFSKISSYIGNGSADGTFVYTGFKPAFVIFKNVTTASTNWHIVDNKRDTFNIVDKLLLPNESGAEITQSALDLTSNGFKIRVTNGFVNNSGDTYIYMAFAENPFVSSTGVPATAR